MSHNKPEQQPSQQQLKAVLRDLLPACQPQEGSPSNTWTIDELQQLQVALRNLNVVPSSTNVSNHNANDTNQSREEGANNNASTTSATYSSSTKSPPFDIQNWLQETVDQKLQAVSSPGASPQEDDVNRTAAAATTTATTKTYTLPRLFREDVRSGVFDGPTNGICPGYLQCNLVVLPKQQSFDFLLFCQRNPKACPLLEVCEGFTSKHLAPGVDLRTDIPKYAIYKNGQLDETVNDVTPHWPDDAVSFLIGCSFSYDGALKNAGIPLKSAQENRNVPMYETNIACEPAGALHGNMVVSMKPIPATMVAREVEITSQYPHAHGGPVCVGCPQAIGIRSLNQPDWGDAIEVSDTEVPVFHACGVTPQAILMESKVPFAITHAAGHMLVTDQPSDMGLL